MHLGVATHAILATEVVALVVVNGYGPVGR